MFFLCGGGKMKSQLSIKLLSLVCLIILLVTGFAFFVWGRKNTVYAQNGDIPENITVEMYTLTREGAIDGSQEEPLCMLGGDGIPADLRRGCTAFNQEDYPDPADQRPYPYDANPATTSIEDDYLLDVVPQEMGPAAYHPTAIHAQAGAARTYAYCAIHAWDEYAQESDYYWAGCLREINNSNGFQVFVPFYFDTLSINHQQTIQDATSEII
jgi:hypothetical protein